MANFNAIRLQLRSINDEIQRSPVLGWGRPIDDDKADECAAVLDGLKDRLNIALRELRNAEHANELRRRQTYNVPFDQRHRVNDAVRTAETDIDELSTEVQRLNERIKKLLVDNGILNAFEASQKTSELVEQLQKTVDQIAGTHQEVGQVTNVPVYTQGHQPQTQYSTLVPMVVLACLGVCRLKEKLTARKKP